MPNARYSMQKSCSHCGREYLAARSSSQFCSDRCRVQHHRQRNKAVNEPLSQAAELIRSIGALTEGELSFEAIVALKNLRKMVDFQDVSRKDSWWRCQKCWRAVQKVIPVDGDCSCGKCENARWQLQKRMI
jgi:predicted nucleic acid-binding Zn ribbon protein